MLFKNFRLQLLLRLLALLICVYLLAAINFTEAYRATYVGLVLFILLQVILLISFQEKTNRQVIRFLNAIRFDDFTEQFKAGGEGKIHSELAIRLNEVMNKFRSLRADKEANLQYYEAIVQHIGTGIITYKPDGTILLMNNAAKKLLQHSQASHVQDLQVEPTGNAAGLLELVHGDKVLMQLRQSGELGQLSVHVMELSLLGSTIRLASLQNIQPELEDKEMEAWHNLIKVLTHEIMNSVTPISSLAASAGEEVSSYTDTTATEITLLKEELEDIGLCLQTISRRSQGLIHFVSDFRNLTAVKAPHLQLFNVGELLKELRTLMREQMMNHGVVFNLDLAPQNLLLNADRTMVEQVLINLIKNAMEATLEGEQPKQVTVKACLDERSRTSIEITDNGSGMTPEAMSKIFIPFYTTKKTGSGIGLSLSRQIMRLHKGTITVQSELGRGTTFTLRF
ncbi:GHKL domain-containing protein [Pontibacter qinzhouensis]|uniref:histidine kinase n=1 Tax=Pontibacter qinzhouensis TaxID=2603253 RepID=A0A5C8JGU2_9BACT|nr:ATP-binding protein [Pontibacter qinzhouensis]TXK36959.1 GHKL domain-containing protein [Pontibacter qinzhouensis]